MWFWHRKRQQSTEQNKETRNSHLPMEIIFVTAQCKSGGGKERWLNEMYQDKLVTQLEKMKCKAFITLYTTINLRAIKDLHVKRKH